MNIHALIIIKNNGKYLQYYDKDWDSYLFPNIKLNEEFTDLDIIEYVESTIKKQVEECTFIKYIDHEKYSVKHKSIRRYKHYFYLVTLDNYEIDDNYKFFTIEELENNRRVMEVNKDIIDIVKDLNL